VGPEQIALNILTTPSHLVKQLQLADLVTSITAAMVSGQDRYAKPLFPIVKSMLIGNHYGYIGGTGLKLFPDSLINLYYWILDEARNVKVSHGAGIALPHSAYAYSKAWS